MITTTRYQGTFHGAPESAGWVRAGLRQFLAGCPRADDAVLIASEFASNAVLHSRSAGDVFMVRAEVYRDYCWVEVEDLGGPWFCRQRDGDRPHGFDIVTALVGENWGIENAAGCRVVWARVHF